MEVIFISKRFDQFFGRGFWDEFTIASRSQDRSSLRCFVREDLAFSLVLAAGPRRKRYYTASCWFHSVASNAACSFSREKPNLVAVRIDLLIFFHVRS